jgi:hypothetical protein
MRTGFVIAVVGIALMVGAGGTWLVLHEPHKDEARALPKGSQTFGLPPQIPVPVPQVQNTLTHDALLARGREAAPSAPVAPVEPSPEPPPEYKCKPKGDWNDPNCPKADADEVTLAKVVHHSAKPRHHKAQRKRHSRPVARLKSKWVQQQPADFSLERLFNGKR